MIESEFCLFRCQFHQHFTCVFFVQKLLQRQNVSRKKAFVRKIRAFNVDEIDFRLIFLFIGLTRGETSAGDVKCFSSSVRLSSTGPFEFNFKRKFQRKVFERMRSDLVLR